MGERAHRRVGACSAFSAVKRRLREGLGKANKFIPTLAARKNAGALGEMYFARQRPQVIALSAIPTYSYGLAPDFIRPPLPGLRLTVSRFRHVAHSPVRPFAGSPIRRLAHSPFRP
jgi:hypothetical protein